MTGPVIVPPPPPTPPVMNPVKGSALSTTIKIVLVLAVIGGAIYGGIVVKNKVKQYAQNKIAEKVLGVPELGTPNTFTQDEVRERFDQNFSGENNWPISDRFRAVDPQEYLKSLDYVSYNIKYNFDINILGNYFSTDGVTEIYSHIDKNKDNQITELQQTTQNTYAFGSDVTIQSSNYNLSEYRIDPETNQRKDYKILDSVFCLPLSDKCLGPDEEVSNGAENNLDFGDYTESISLNNDYVYFVGFDMILNNYSPCFFLSMGKTDMYFCMHPNHNVLLKLAILIDGKPVANMIADELHFESFGSILPQLNYLKQEWQKKK